MALEFEIISKLDSYFLMTVIAKAKIIHQCKRNFFAASLHFFYHGIPLHCAAQYRLEKRYRVINCRPIHRRPKDFQSMRIVGAFQATQ